MARTRQWADDSTMQIKFSGGGSLTVSFKGNLFDLLPNERALISVLSETIQQFQEKPEPGTLTEVKQA